MLNFVDTQATLTSLAMLKVHADSRTQRDYIDYLKPFVVYSLKKRNVYPVTRENVKDFLKEDFGLIIPVRGCELVLKRLRKAGHLEREKGSFKLKKDLPQDDIAARRTDAERRAHSVLNSLTRYAKEHHEIEIDNDKATKLFLAYLKTFSIQCLQSYSQGTALPSSNEIESKGLTLVAFFIQNAAEHVPDLFDDIVLLVRGHMLSNALLCPDLEHYEREFKNVEFFLDTPIIIDLLQLHGTHEYEAAKELMSLVKKLSGKFYVFSHVIDEVKSVLKFSERNFDNSNTDNRILIYIRAQGMTGSDITLVRGKLNDKLRKHGVQIRTTPRYQIRHQIDEKALQEVLEESSKYPNPNARITDINSIRSIYVLRANSHPNSLEDAKAILVTPNARLARQAYKFGKKFEESQEVSSIINEFSLGNIAWLKAPLESEHLPELEVITTCYAIMQPSPQFWEKFLAEIHKLRDVGNISPHDHAFLRSEVKIRKELMGLTLGSEDELTTETISEAKARVLKEFAQEKDKEIEIRNEKIQKIDRRLSRVIENHANTRNRVEAISNNIASILAILISGFIALLLMGGLILPWLPVGVLPVQWRWLFFICAVILGLVTIGNLVLGMTVRKLYGRIKEKISQTINRRILSLLSISEIEEGHITKPNDKPTSGDSKASG